MTENLGKRSACPTIFLFSCVPDSFLAAQIAAKRTPPALFPAAVANERYAVLKLEVQTSRDSVELSVPSVMQLKRRIWRDWVSNRGSIA